MSDRQGYTEYRAILRAKTADLMIFRHEKDLHLWNFTYLCKREVKGLFVFPVILMICQISVRRLKIEKD
jgi:hypothetical protein